MRTAKYHIFKIMLSIFILSGTACIKKKVNNAPVKLLPLSPFTYTFTTPTAKKDGTTSSKNEYFFLNNNQETDRFLIAELHKKFKILDTGNYPNHSIYIYNKTETLNQNFKGNRDQLKGLHDDDLRVYIRYKMGKMDLFYLLKDGKVVYDGLHQIKIDPPFEFD
ncbi:hypothetical protein DF947_21730 [Pedobacter paludis]|uniref:Lipoprotein n=2 Tax=Pedobacter paludis TaxID=2203212 RepID=A0A317ERX2_9SPHI|nr:hypothetical protein DF947_21730 [Pedobacter paludis]